MTNPLNAIEAAVAAVTDLDDAAQIIAACRAVSPAMIDDIVFGTRSSTDGAAADGSLLVVGVGVSPGTGVGRAALSTADALTQWESGIEVILVLDSTSPADEPAMRVASGIVTRSGGQASHAAIIARQWGVPAVCSIGDLEIEPGEELLLDGATGEVRRFAVPNSDSDSEQAVATSGPLRELPAAVQTLLSWADDLVAGTIRVVANADTAEDAALSKAFGAVGIGLCRTEHHFLGEHASLVGRLINGDDTALEGLIAQQRSALVELITNVDGATVVRLLDAPSHEFTYTPSGASPSEINGGKPEEPAESNPMLGVRGARLLLSRPDLLHAQGEAIAHAVCDCVDADGNTPEVEVLVPMVALASEMRAIRAVLSDTFFRVGIERGQTLNIPVGAMIETPRAALAAAGLATVADFFSFGTNDLTQLTWGIARDDRGGQLISDYQGQGLIDRSPFETLDGIGVVRLMALAAETGRANNENLRLTMCGEHGGDPMSISIAVQLKIDSVSVSPYRVPAARLAAAHAITG